MRAVVGDHLTAGQAAEMVAQHIVTIPIFDCLFADSQFARANPVAVAMNTLLQSFAPRATILALSRYPLPCSRMSCGP